MLLHLLCTVLLSGSVLCHGNCSYQRIINHLNLTNKDLFTLSRPVRNAGDTLEVHVEFKPNAILDVREADQTFISYNNIEIMWENQHIEWDETEFCWIESITVPSELLWQPDLRILEVVEKDKSPSSPFLRIRSDGTVLMKIDQIVLSACKMDVYKFPFDTQSCKLSFQSFVHSADEMKLKSIGSGISITEKVQDTMHTQYEWLFEYINVTKDDQKEKIVYTINMRRRAILYIVNFILPVLFFLALDFASFLMTDRGGDKLGFKITILLAVTVLQLLLNDILPSSSNNIPLIAVFCLGVFWLMKLSLLETIIVMYLRERDSKDLKTDPKTDPEKTEPDDGDNGLKTESCCKRLKNQCDLLHEPTDDKEDQTERRSVVDGGSDLDRLLLDLRHVTAALSEAVGGDKEQETGYWSSRIYLINRMFLLVYSVCTVLFLGAIFYHWLN